MLPDEGSSSVPPRAVVKRNSDAITCPKEEVLRRLQRETTCSSCCSALRVMIQRPLHQLTLLQSFVSHEDDSGYVLKENLATPKSLEEACAKFPLHEWLKNCQPLKRDKRCPMHANSRHIFNSADLWEDMWAEMSPQQKQSICSVNAEELHDKLWQHCTDKHHLCKDCRNNVMWAFDKLTKKDMPLVGTEAEQEAERASLQAYFHVDDSKDGHICVHASALPTILYHYEDTLAEESENSTKGRHAPTRQAGLSELLCVVGRLLLRKVLTSYQSSLEEEQNQQLLVRLVLSYFQAQALERQAAANMESLLEEDNTPSKSGASKRKLKKDRRLKRQEQEIEDAAQTGGEVTWDEDQELSLLTQMGWSKCMGSTCVAPTCAACATSASAEQTLDDSPSSPVESAVQLQLEVSADMGAEAAEAARLKLQLSVEEWLKWEQQKDDLLEERQRIREQLKLRFEEFCERSGVGALHVPSFSRDARAC
uniref:Uncharacterized protein n=1 Tax=Haptolina brevifila TaxID=156173 RepID=A0A7S2CP54_9EUKA|mmetsp:Transcript_26312/g.52817  ORF Transcript_26312/g.52817 Transcript_26312/m.52817 type:complete len:480 (+) Transcript_26312:54-1493(+)